MTVDNSHEAKTARYQAQQPDGFKCNAFAYNIGGIEIEIAEDKKAARVASYICQGVREITAWLPIRQTPAGDAIDAGGYYIPMLNVVPIPAH